MYYQLNEKYAFRGWKRLPYALRIMKGEGRLDKPVFFNKEDFLLLLCCNGVEVVNEGELPESQRSLLQKLAENAIIRASGEPMSGLKDYQRYHVYPGIYYSALQWSITGKCNYRCRHCFLSAPSSRHPELPLSDCLRIIEQMSVCGVRQVDLTGGEPLLRTDFLEIVRSLTEHGIFIRLIFTNASLLNEQLLDALDKLDQHPAFQLSYDGVGCHSWLRGIPQAEEDLRRAIKLLHKRKVDYSCAMCIHKGNAEVLDETVKLLAQYGCRGLGVNTPQELGNWQEFSEKYALSYEETWELYKA
jgi:sulfatase maturation enzyme AslB (radical SAM superfamily)